MFLQNVAVQTYRRYIYVIYLCDFLILAQFYCFYCILLQFANKLCVCVSNLKQFCLKTCPIDNEA